MSFNLFEVKATDGKGMPLLRGIHLSGATGERIAVIGPPAAGKSTLLRILGAELCPTAGNVELFDAQPWDLSGNALRRLRARISVIPQRASVATRLSVVSTVLAGRLGLWPLKKAAASLVYPLDTDGARRALAQLDIEEHLYERCDLLSECELQRVHIARGLYECPDMMLADNPEAGLTAAWSHRSLRLLTDDARMRGSTLVASLDSVDLALEHFERIIGLRAGSLAFDLPRDRINETLLRALYAPEGWSVPSQAAEAHYESRGNGAPPAVHQQ